MLISKLADKTDSGFLAANLPEGMRAITISTDAISGVAGYVFPGDRIDLLFTHNIPEKGATGGGSSKPAFSIPGISIPSVSSGGGEGAAYAEVLVSNIPVLAVNVRDSGESTQSSFIPSAESIATAVISGGGSTPSSLTLQVTDIQAEKIRLAESSGTLTVSLRSVKDRENQTIPAPTNLESLTQIPLGSGTKLGNSDNVKVIRGATNSNSAAPSSNPFGAGAQ